MTSQKANKAQLPERAIPNVETGYEQAHDDLIYEVGRMSIKMRKQSFLQTQIFNIIDTKKSILSARSARRLREYVLIGYQFGLHVCARHLKRQFPKDDAIRYNEFANRLHEFRRSFRKGLVRLKTQEGYPWEA